MVAIYYFETVLKNFRELRHKDAPVLHISSSILQKFCNFIVLKQVLSIGINFHNNWLKIWPDLRNLVSYLMRNYKWNLQSLPQMASQIKCKNLNNFRSRFDFGLRFFLKLYFWKVFYTAWKVSVFGVFLVRIFPYSGWIGIDTPNLSVSVQLWENKGSTLCMKW